MKLHFEPGLDYQHTAIEAVCDLFRGQETCRTEFTVTRDVTAAQYAFAFRESDLGIGTACTCSTMRSSRTSTTYRFAMVYDHQAHWPRATSPWRWRGVVNLAGKSPVGLRCLMQEP